jgi:hypothetical protein
MILAGISRRSRLNLLDSGKFLPVSYSDLEQEENHKDRR